MKKSEMAATIEAQAEEIKQLRSEKARRILNYRYRFCYLRSERDSVLNTYPKEIKQLNEFRIAVTHAIQRPDFCSIENLARYVKADFAFLQEENQRLREQLIKYKRSECIGDDR